MKTLKHEILVEDFARSVPEFRLDAAAEACAKRHKGSHRVSEVESNVDNMCDELRLLLKHYITSGQFSSQRDANRAMMRAQIALNSIKDDALELLSVPGRQRGDIADMLKKIINIRVGEFTRNI